jgi:hypothetical protein
LLQTERTTSDNEGVKLSLPFFFVFLVCAPAFAEDCAEVRLDKAGGSLEKIAVLDQDGTDTCYAYTAAYLFDSYRYREMRAKNILDSNFSQSSPLVAAAEFAKFKNKETIDKGNVGQTLKQLINNGGCPHQIIGDQFGAYDINGFLKELKIYFEALSPNNGIKRNAIQGISALSLACYLQESQIPDPFEHLQDLNLALKEFQFIHFLNTTFQASCKNHRWKPMKEPVLKIEMAKEDPKSRRIVFEKILNKIDSQNSSPIGAYVCLDFFHQSKFIGVQKNGKPNPDCSLHSTLVMGKRKNNKGQCQVLLRNSWGASCEGYSLEKENCENGQLWVDQEHFFRNLLGTIELE